MSYQQDFEHIRYEDGTHYDYLDQPLQYRQQTVPRDVSSDHYYSSPSPSQRRKPQTECRTSMLTERECPSVEQGRAYPSLDPSANEYEEDHAYYDQAGSSQQPQKHQDSQAHLQFSHRHYSPYHTAGSSNLQRSNGIRLVPVSNLPDLYRPIFKFGVFNAIQSKCYDTAMNSDENMVISAPTGSGKTVLFELAIIRLLRRGGAKAKCVYMAPTKALCTEKFNDWTKKFQHVGVKCCEFTGDTDGTAKNAWKAVQDATIIVTTPEKWDSLTRNWCDHQVVLSQMQLFLVDEVHILNESRGSTLEVCISRMKTRGTSVRFILLSATAPNIEDIARWVGSSQSGTESNAASVFKSARLVQFGEQYRPCKITRLVYSYPQKQQNAFQFSRTLDFKLFELLQRHGGGKPALIFCPTRKGVASSAERLAKDYKKCLNAMDTLPWPLPSRNTRTFQDHQLAELYKSGLGVHHAGLSLDDRRTTEELFLSGNIQILVATSTLAMGVNLPAHTVVIKGTQMWSGSGWTEYSEMDVMQMIGRAGRPQFDTEGLAIILCASDKEQHYRAVSSGNTMIESCLHLHLTEHLNSEIGLGTVTDLESAKAWLQNSYFFQRLQRNPSHYDVGKLQDQTWQDRLDELVGESVKDLSSIDLVATVPDASGKATALSATDYGEIMSRYYIRYTTMGLILQLPDKATLRDILETLSQADEFSDIRVRGSDKQVYNALRAHMDIRMTMKKVEKSMDKVMILIQAVLGGISLNTKDFKTADSQPHLEALGVFKHATRIAQAIVDIAIVRKSGSQAKYGLELVRSLAAKAWDDRPVVLRQIPQIGEKSIKVLATSGVTNIAKLRTQEAYRLELLLNRKPPFGTHLLGEVAALPQYTLRLKEETINPSNGFKPVSVTLVIEAGLAVPLPSGVGKKRGPLGFASLLTITSDHDFVDFRRLPVHALSEHRSFRINVEFAKASQSVIVMISSENHAGLSVVETYKPSLAPTLFPTLDTRPKTAIDFELDSMNDIDPGFWTITKDEFNDLTGKSALKDTSLPQQNNRTDVTTEKPSSQSQEPVRLPNGHFQCNHACKDKQMCRHLCCKDGALKAPAIRPAKRSSKPATASTTEVVGSLTETTDLTQGGSTGPPSKRVKSASSIKQNAGQSNTKAREHAMNELDTVHSRTNVALKIPAGKRISLKASDQQPGTADSPEWMRSPKFTPLEDETPKKPKQDDGDDSGSLPDIFNNIPPKTEGNSKEKDTDESEYGDSEFDALFADASPTALSSQLQPQIQATDPGVGKGVKRSRAEVNALLDSGPRSNAGTPSKKAKPARVLQSPLSHRHDDVDNSHIPSRRVAPRDSSISAAIREKPLFLAPLSSSPISGGQNGTGKVKGKGKAIRRSDTISAARSILSVCAPSSLPRDNAMEPELESFSQPFGTLADFSLDPALFELEADPTAGGDEDCDQLMELDYEDEGNTHTRAINVVVDNPEPLRTQVAQSRDQSVASRKLPRWTPLVTDTMDRVQTHLPGLAPAPPNAPTMIAPGVERTGDEAYDDFFDWMYNSGQVEIVDS